MSEPEKSEPEKTVASETLPLHPERLPELSQIAAQLVPMTYEEVAKGILRAATGVASHYLVAGVMGAQNLPTPEESVDWLAALTSEKGEEGKPRPISPVILLASSTEVTDAACLFLFVDENYVSPDRFGHLFYQHQTRSSGPGGIILAHSPRGAAVRLLVSAMNSILRIAGHREQVVNMGAQNGPPRPPLILLAEFIEPGFRLPDLALREQLWA